MKRISFIFLLQLLALVVFAQAPADYYVSAEGKNKAPLKTALYNVIKGHTPRTYAYLWTDFQTTDKRADGKVWDMYSNCAFTFGSNQCGNYGGVCDCYNREHSFPKSWFNDATPMYTDLFHLYPTDGYTNGRRSNYPFGEVENVTWSGNDGCKLGSAKSDLGYTGTVFEPADEYKGDFARTYFYMVTRYDNVVASWFSNSEAKPTLNGTTYPAFTTWTQEMLLKWHRQDPVSEKETDRNNAVYGIQENRNPFIDYPELAEYIWGNKMDEAWSLSTSVNEVKSAVFSVTPNPAKTHICVSGTFSDKATYAIYNLSGIRLLADELIAEKDISIETLSNGMYLLEIRSENTHSFSKFIVNK